MRATVLFSLLLVACVGDHGVSPDVDDGKDDTNGSGSSAANGLDPSPGDITLDLGVVGLSAIVVVGSFRSRRRDDLPKPEL
jgi:hypothetical protein